MDAKRCDRCGKFYIHLSETNGCRFCSIVENRERVVSAIGNSCNDFDICPDCWESFKKWMENT